MSNYLTLSQEEIDCIEKKIGYSFLDKKLLCKAFTHSSYTNENKAAASNERLEFLGDRIINFIAASDLFFNASGNEGRLTELLINKVSKQPLALSVQKLGIFSYLKKSKGTSFSANSKAESDLYEALVAAIYVDSSSIKCCSSFIERTLVNVEIVDYISLLKIHCERNPSVKIDEKTLQNAQSGKFTHKITLDGSVFEGEGASKDEAKRLASEKVCAFLKILQG